MIPKASTIPLSAMKLRGAVMKKCRKAKMEMTLEASRVAQCHYCNFNTFNTDVVAAVPSSTAANLLFVDL
ncbi:hypothetical protein ACH5RR_003373 [Cinchona calisaya]|uniref:Uncharacterized protein n=1 Tax=Cinchona calisaya TaxID=153742 RepID=A0ABD3AVC1_9GENT